MGGVKINTACEVLKADGSAIPGLFAAGEFTGCLLCTSPGGSSSAPSLEGRSVLVIYVLGKCVL